MNHILGEYPVYDPDPRDGVEPKIKVERVEGTVEVGTPQDVARFLHKYKKNEREMIVVLHLDLNFEVKLVEHSAVGSRMTCTFSVSDIFRSAIVHKTDAIIIAHNHPQEKTIRPTPEDIEATKKLHLVGQAANLPIIDHVILGSEGHFSFKHKGLVFNEGGTYSMKLTPHAFGRIRKSKGKTKDQLLRMIGKINRDFIIK
jgi:hypothetical protein